MKNVINRALVAKKKLTLLFAALLLASTALCLEKQTVSYTYPVYNTDGDPTSGIKEWKTATEYGVFVLTSYNSNVSVGTAGESSWYVVTGSDVTLSKGFYCVGNVNLILADGAKLTVGENIYTAGIQVSGEGNSLTIYGQANQSGKLIATGGNGGDAGIGGKKINPVPILP